MNPLLFDVMKRRIKAPKGLDDKAFEEMVRVRATVVTRQIVELSLIVLGAAVASFGLKGFLLPNHFLDGGVTGISLIINAITDWRLSILIVVLNVPFLLLGRRTISSRFAFRSLIGVVALGTLVYVLPIPSLTKEPILIAAFGGFFLGLGIGLAIRGGGILDGTEVLAIWLSRRTPLTVGNVILLMNLVIFSSAAWLIDLQTALYAILTYLAAAKTVDFVVDGVEQYIGINIISVRSDAIRKAITEVLGRGCTVYHGSSGFAPAGRKPLETDIIYTVVTRLELARLKLEVDKVDPTAFVVMTPVIDVKGGMIKKKPLDVLH